MRLHMPDFQFWECLTNQLPCLPSLTAPAQSIISEKTTYIEKEKLLADYDDRPTSYKSQFRAYQTWHEDVQSDSVLAAQYVGSFCCQYCGT
jgi:hypothetical protein